MDKKTMIACVNMISDAADEYFENGILRINVNDREEYNQLCADAFNRKSGAIPILRKLGMTFRECREYKE